MAGPGWASRRRAKPMSTPGSTGVEGARGTCHGVGGWWQGLAGLRDDAPSRRLAARTARGRAAALRHTQRPGPTAPGTPVGLQATKAGRLPSVGTPSSPAQQGTPSSPAPQRGPMVPGTPAVPLIDARIQAERPASSVARWTPPRSASWAAWVRQEKPSARYTASGCADRDGSSEWDATATDRS